MMEAPHDTRPETAPSRRQASTSSRGRPRIVSVVLNWNGGREIEACLKALRTVEPSGRVLTLLADNGSTDGSVEAAVAEHSDLHVLRFGSNLGYSAGNNRAMRYAFGEMEADWVCLLNSDVQVSPEMFGRLLRGVAEAEADGRGPVGAAGPCLYFTDRPDVVWARGGRVGPGLNVTRLIGHGQRSRGTKSPCDVDYLPGACLLLSRRAFEQAGALDEAYFCYLEDADWGVRLRQAGLRSVVVPDATALHCLSASTGGGYTAGRKYMTAVNSVRFLRQHGGLAEWLALFFFDLLLWPVAFVLGALRGRTAGTLAKLRGILDGFRGLQVDATVAARYARKRP